MDISLTVDNVLFSYQMDISLTVDKVLFSYQMDISLTVDKVIFSYQMDISLIVDNSVHHTLLGKSYRHSIIPDIYCVEMVITLHMIALSYKAV